MKKGLVTLLIGKHFQQRWKLLCEANWRKYAKRHDYELICITDPLDISLKAASRSPAWQKCLITRSKAVTSCDRVVWVDADIVMSDLAPCIVQGVPESKVGAVELFAHFGNGLEREVLLSRAQREAGLPATTAQEMYASARLDTFASVVQTGVMVISPEHHREYFEKVYQEGVETAGSYYEMMALSAELMRQDAVHWIDERFNDTIMEVLLKYYPFLLATSSDASLFQKAKKRFLRSLVLSSCIDAARKNSWFFHYAGYGSYMEARNYWGILS